MENFIIYENKKIFVSKEIFDFIEADDKRLSSVSRQDRRRLSSYELMESYHYRILTTEKDCVVDYISLKEEYLKLEYELNNLGEKEKKRIYKYYFQEKTCREIAKDENVSVQAIKKSIANGLKKMYKALINQRL